jgi:hypothetical protein
VPPKMRSYLLFQVLYPVFYLILLPQNIPLNIYCL